MRGVQYLILRVGLFFFFMLVTSPIAIVCGLMMKYLEAHEQVRILKWIFAPGLVAWLFGVPWLSSRAAEHMAFEDRTFGVAAKLAFWDLRLRLVFLPLVGHWFAPDTNTKDDDDHDAS